MLDVYLDPSPNAIGAMLLLTLVDIVWQARIICNGSVSFPFPRGFFYGDPFGGAFSCVIIGWRSRAIYDVELVRKWKNRTTNYELGCCS